MHLHTIISQHKQQQQQQKTHCVVTRVSQSTKLTSVHQDKMTQLVSASSTLLATATLLLLLSAAGAAAAAATPTPPRAQAAAAGAACHNDIVALRTTCYDYVQEGGRTLPPSSSCCATLIGLTNIPCVCNYLGSDLDIDQDKVSYVCRSCGVAIPRGCGDLKQV